MPEPIALKTALVATMFELLDATEHDHIGSRIRLGGGPTSPEVYGSKSNHRPDLFAKNSRGKPVLVETVTREDMKDLKTLHEKLYLFFTASECYTWDFHLACFAALAPHLRNFCSKNEIKFSKLWEI